MSKKNKKGFTLIELVAVLVIMAIIALIVTPLVMSIIRKAKIAADKRSVDAYGRSIELAIAGYLMDTGTIPTSISQLTIEYSGDEVVCSTTQLKSDSSIYLAGCTVGGRSVEGYTYGKEEATPTYTAYSVGDEVSYNNVDYYVIADSDQNDATIKLIKKTPLTTAQVNQYGGVETENNHVNYYVATSYSEYYVRAAYDVGGYGGMAYYSGKECNCHGFGSLNSYACTNVYADSEIKYVLDSWAQANVPSGLQEVRLITTDELSNLGGVIPENATDTPAESTELPSWLYSNDYSYWAIGLNESNKSIIVTTEGLLSYSDIRTWFAVVRPVVVLSKSVL